MIKSNIRLLIQIFAVCILCVGGCEPSSVANKNETSFSNSSVTKMHSLGWMGAKTHPLLDTFKIVDPDNEDKEVTPGGVVVVELTEDSPLEKAGVRAVSYTHLTLPTKA